MDLNTKVIQLNRVGDTVARQLKRLQVETVRDLLFYFPFRYEDYSKVFLIKDLRVGVDVTIKGKIELIGAKRSPRKRTMITEAIVVDESDRLRVVWFGQPFIAKTLHVGDEVYFSGQVKDDFFGKTMVGPNYEKIKDQRPMIPAFSAQLADTAGEGGGGLLGATHTARIVPMYPLTAGITQKQIRFLISQVIDLADKLPDWLPEEILDPPTPFDASSGLRRARLLSFSEAIKKIHFPGSQAELDLASHRLKFDELYILQLKAELSRQAVKNSLAPVIKFNELATREFVASLPFVLTKAQKIAAWEILQDLAKPMPMNRLLQGDVGSGKTVVAGIAMYNAVLNGFQAVLMAPTEILALQHYETLKRLFGEKASVCLITGRGSQKSKVESQKLRDEIKSGEINIVVGTHAVLTESVEFKNLGLVIVDEQHRFGVEQRKLLHEKRGASANPTLTLPCEGRESAPHFLSMSATPIPRSFALAIYGDLDVSAIREMPVGRKPVISRLVEPKNREKAYEFIRAQVRLGRQVFVVCPAISQKSKVESQKFDSDGVAGYRLQAMDFSEEKKSVMSEYEKLSKQIFPDLKVGFLHGKLKSKEKEETMLKFRDKEIGVLVATSVVEVGVDIPNASVMMIEGAERFGLAQLHQFRGRVGRSGHQSYCLLFSDCETDKAKECLAFFEKNTDGFKVAEYDLQTRGPGQVYGVEQSGMMNLRFATLQDVFIIKQARDLARGIDFDKYPTLKEKVKEWEERVHLE